MTVATRLRISPESTFLVLVASLCTAALTVLSLDSYWLESSALAPALVVDLALGLPVLGYLTLVRRGGRSAALMLPLAIAGLLLARWWIPAVHLDFGLSLEVVALALEGGLLLLLLVRLRRARAAYALARPTAPYGLDALRTALSEVLGPRTGAAVMGEVGVLWYAVFGWRRRRETHPDGAVFSGYRRSGYTAVLVAILMAVAAETAAVHLIVSLWREPVAWVLTILGVYSALWLLGDYHAARLNPSVVTARRLHIRTGLRWSADVELAGIAAVHGSVPESEEEPLKLALWGEPNVWVETREPVAAHGPFGIRREGRVLGLSVDDPDAFKALVEAESER